MKQSLRRCVLFVGGLDLGKLPAALESGADMVCIDIEDAVPPHRKDEARAGLAMALKGMPPSPSARLIVRVNSLRSLHGVADFQALLAETTALGGLLMPKVESAEEIRWAAALQHEAGRQRDLYAIIETPQAVERCAEIALAHHDLRGLFFGGFDLSTALGCTTEWEPLLHARSRVVQAAALAEIDAIDSPFQDLRDREGLRLAAERAKALGMTGKTTKYPEQVRPIIDVFTPTAREIDRAREILALFEQDPAKPLVYEGKLIELPTIRRIRQTANHASTRDAG